QGPAGESFAEAADERDGGQNFSDGDGVNPNGAIRPGCGGFDRRREGSQALAETVKMLAAAPAEEGEIGEQQEYAQRRQNCVEKIHERARAAGAAFPEPARAQLGIIVCIGRPAAKAFTDACTNETWRENAGYGAPCSGAGRGARGGRTIRQPLSAGKPAGPGAGQRERTGGCPSRP